MIFARKEMIFFIELFEKLNHLKLKFNNGKRNYYMTKRKMKDDDCTKRVRVQRCNFLSEWDFWQRFVEGKRRGVSEGDGGG